VGHEQTTLERRLKIRVPMAGKVKHGTLAACFDHIFTPRFFMPERSGQTRNNSCDGIWQKNTRATGASYRLAAYASRSSCRELRT
jgi:hypothetical protein